MDNAFIRRVFKIAIPISFQAVLNQIINLVDIMMIGRLGEVSIAAVGLANKVFFVFNLIVFGIMSGSQVLIAQFWGSRDIKKVQQTQGIALSVGVGIAMIFTFAGTLVPIKVMNLFSGDAVVTSVGAQYLSIVVISYGLVAVTNVFVATLRGTQNVLLPATVSCMAIVANVGLNYVLIFGHLGFRAMGVRGAAYATLIARAFECMALLLTTYLGKYEFAGTIRELFSFDKAIILCYIRTACPVILNEALWSIGVALYAVAYGKMDSNSVAAMTISETIQNVCTALFQGFGASAGVILGNMLGAGKTKEAWSESAKFIRMELLLSVCAIAVCVLAANPVVSSYSVNEVVSLYAKRCCYAYAASLPFRMFNFVVVVGILRCGGDTGASLAIDVSSVWVIGIPMAFLGVMVWKLPIYWVLFLINLEEVAKAVVGTKRYRQKIWLRNLNLVNKAD